MDTLNFDEMEAEQEGQGVVSIVQTYDLDTVRPRFDDYRAEAIRIAADAKALTVADQDSLNVAVMIGGSAKKIGKAVDAQRKEIILEPKSFVDGVNALCRMITDNLDEAEKTAKQKIGQYQAQQELERRKREADARKAANDLQKKINEEAKAQGVEPPTVVAPVVQEAPKVTRTELGSASQRKAWEFKVTDPLVVPREYLLVSDSKVRDAIKLGVRVIPGIEIFEVTKTVFRT